MIVPCKNCNKKFDINSDLIPQEGRLLECSSCNHRWFFKETKPTTLNPKLNDDTKIDIIISKPKNKSKNILQNLNPSENNEKITHGVKITKTKKNKILSFILLFIITFTAIILLIDTFKEPIEKLVPNIEFILYNLYESIRDIMLFFKDLI